MNLNQRELTIIKFLGDKGNFFRQANESKDKINNEYTYSLIKDALNMSMDEVNESIKLLDKYKLIVLYFDSAYIQLNDLGEKIYLNK